MNKKSKRLPRRGCSFKLLLLLALFLFAVAGGFLGGLYFSEHVPDKAGQIREMSTEAGDAAADQLQGWLDTASLQRWWQRLATSSGSVAQDSTAPIRVFFVPSAKAGASDAEEALTGLINRAQESIACAFYDFELESVARALVARHQAGIQVLLVSDSDYSDRAGLRLCREAGIPVIFDKRSALMHNKFCVVDGRHVWTGSTNITCNGMYENNNNAVLFTSAELATNFSNEFMEMFHDQQFGAGSPQNTTWPTVTIADTKIECYFAPEDGVEKQVVARLAKARQQIAFMAFAFTSKPIAGIMEKRLKAGTRLRGVVEKRNAGSRYSVHKQLNACGADIYIDGNPNTMHHKVIVVDDHLVMTGSYNFSASAEERNDENLIMIHDPDLATTFLGEIERVIAIGTRPD